MNAGEIDLRAESLREIDQRIIAALIRARQHAGLQTRVEMARLMNEATGGKGPDVSTYNRWEEGTRRVPAWALLLAAEVVSQVSELKISVSGLLEEPEDTEQLSSADKAHLRRVEKKVDGLVIAFQRQLELERRRRQDQNSDSQAAGS